MSEKEPKKGHKIENKEGTKEKIKHETEKLGEKTKKLEKTVEKKGGWDTFKKDRLPYVAGAGALLMIASFGGFFPIFTFGFLLWKIFSTDTKTA